MPSYSGAFDFETVTVSNVVTQLTGTKYNPIGDVADASEAHITVEATNALRYTLDGTTPVAATTGHFLAGGASLTIYGGGNIRNFKAVRDGGTNAIIQVTYFRT